MQDLIPQDDTSRMKRKRLMLREITVRLYPILRTDEDSFF